MTYRMGYPEDFTLPEDMAQSHLYKQAGNSVVVPVINRIAKNISKALSHETTTGKQPVSLINV